MGRGVGKALDDFGSGFAPALQKALEQNERKKQLAQQQANFESQEKFQEERARIRDTQRGVDVKFRGDQATLDQQAREKEFGLKAEESKATSRFRGLRLRLQDEANELARFETIARTKDIGAGREQAGEKLDLIRREAIDRRADAASKRQSERDRIELEGRRLNLSEDQIRQNQFVALRKLELDADKLLLGKRADETSRIGIKSREETAFAGLKSTEGIAEAGRKVRVDEAALDRQHQIDFAHTERAAKALQANKDRRDALKLQFLASEASNIGEATSEFDKQLSAIVREGDMNQDEADRLLEGSIRARLAAHPLFLDAVEADSTGDASEAFERETGALLKELTDRAKARGLNPLDAEAEGLSDMADVLNRRSAGRKGIVKENNTEKTVQALMKNIRATRGAADPNQPQLSARFAETPDDIVKATRASGMQPDRLEQALRNMPPDATAKAILKTINNDGGSHVIQDPIGGGFIELGGNLDFRADVIRKLQDDSEEPLTVGGGGGITRGPPNSINGLLVEQLYRGIRDGDPELTLSYLGWNSKNRLGIKNSTRDNIFQWISDNSQTLLDVVKDPKKKGLLR